MVTGRDGAPSCHERMLYPACADCVDLPAVLGGLELTMQNFKIGHFPDGGLILSCGTKGAESDLVFASGAMYDADPVLADQRAILARIVKAMSAADECLMLQELLSEAAHHLEMHASEYKHPAQTDLIGRIKNSLGPNVKGER